MKRPMDAWFALRRARVAPDLAREMSEIYRDSARSGHGADYIALVICARMGLEPIIWQDRIKEALR